MAKAEARKELINLMRAAAPVPRAIDKKEEEKAPPKAKEPSPIGLIFHKKVLKEHRENKLTPYLQSIFTPLSPKECRIACRLMMAHYMEKGDAIPESTLGVIIKDKASLLT